ncbi:hypothetical protein [Taibaiella helva]|uniref:hypothetical protein n=1 Tax=Taibaiella helva TaxID=2301235 RepID=UPI000E57ADD6|nr:hypothetical protein [Taibaiella helva]
MKLIVLLLGLLYTNAALGNSIDSVRRYYELKNKAELSIMDGAYSDALKNYVAAFAYKSPNSLDLYNAFTTAFLVGDSVQSRRFFNLMALHGQPKGNLEKLNKDLRGKPFYNWLSQDYDSIRALSLKSSMPVFSRLLDSIYHIDAGYRQELKTQQQIKEMIDADKVNLQYIKSYIKQYGFPGYTQVGLFEELLNGWPHAYNTFWLLMWHTRHISKDLNQVALDAVMAGDMSPDDYAIAIDAQDSIKTYFAILPKGKQLPNERFDKIFNAAEVDRKRAQIFLEPIAAYQRKLVFQNSRTTHFIFKPAMQMALNFATADLSNF